MIRIMMIKVSSNYITHANFLSLTVYLVMKPLGIDGIFHDSVIEVDDTSIDCNSEGGEPGTIT